MPEHHKSISRRDALKICLGFGAGLSLTPDPIWAGRRSGPPGYTAADLVTKAIPSSGERVPIIGIGTARRYDVGTSEAERAPLRDVLQTFAEMGGQIVDTAAGYGNAETVVGDLVAELGIRDQLFFATKTGAGDGGAAAGIREMERSFDRLHTDHIELMFVHNLRGWQNMFPVLREWKEAGRIKYYGTTTTRPSQYEELMQIMRQEPIDFIEVDYAIDNRDVENHVLPLAQEQGIAVLVALPFGRGRVFDEFGDQPLPEWASEFGIETWAQFALKYVVSHPAVTAAIPGTAKMTYLTDNINAARGPLPDQATRARMAAIIDG